MAWANRKAEPAAKPVMPLYERIAAFRQELEAFVNSRAAELTKGTGLPMQVVLQTMTGGSHCVCSAALRVVRDIEEEKEIARRQA
jgi:hypothetical protein